MKWTALETEREEGFEMRGVLLALGCFALSFSVGCGAQMQRRTSYEPTAASTLPPVTDRCVKFFDADQERIKAAGGESLGTMRIEHETEQSASGEGVLWPGASSDAAHRGATHARLAKANGGSPHKSPLGKPGRGGVFGGGAHESLVEYELWRVDPARWEELPGELRPKPLDNVKAK